MALPTDYVRSAYLPFVALLSPDDNVYATRILENRREYGTKENTLQLLKACKKEKHKQCWEARYMQVFRQKKVLIDELQISDNKGKRDSCRNFYKQLQILTLPSQYIFSLLIFVAQNRDLFLSNSEIHDINTRFNYNLHLPTTNLTLVQKGVLYSGSRIYNHLTIHIKSLSNDPKQFKSKLKAFLLEHTCYSLEEFY